MSYQLDLKANLPRVQIYNVALLKFSLFCTDYLSESGNCSPRTASSATSATTTTTPIPTTPTTPDIFQLISESRKVQKTNTNINITVLVLLVLVIVIVMALLLVTKWKPLFPSEYSWEPY